MVTRGEADPVCNGERGGQGANFSGHGEEGGEGGSERRVLEEDNHSLAPAALEVKSPQKNQEQAGGNEVPHHQMGSYDVVQQGGGSEIGAGVSQGPVHLKQIPKEEANKADAQPWGRSSVHNKARVIVEELSTKHRGSGCYYCPWAEHRRLWHIPLARWVGLGPL